MDENTLFQGSGQEASPVPSESQEVVERSAEKPVVNPPQKPPSYESSRSFLGIIKVIIGFLGVSVNGIQFGGKKEEEVRKFFEEKNDRIGQARFILKVNDTTLTISAKELGFGYDEVLLAHQAYTIGRSDNVLSNISLVLQAYINGVNLPASYHIRDDKLEGLILPIKEKIDVAPVDALFTFQNGKVDAFRPSINGQEVDMEGLKNKILANAPIVILSQKTKDVVIEIPIKSLLPAITTDKVNNLGIKELIGTGTSLFQHSIPNRVYNVTLASSRINGILVKPGETFSFDQALGDVSSFTGYKQAYVIENGKTVLGDGGGVCQVSTTLFRALLNAGLPIVERHAHAYRVGYYEEDSPPGLDATVYVPSYDLRFKNDSGNYILIQSSINPDIEQLTFSLYGTRDGRTVSLSKPVITNYTPAPADVYQDDPTLPKGQVKQVDFAAPGSDVSFTREVSKDGKVIISEKFSSSYRPWQAVFLRGTKE